MLLSLLTGSLQVGDHVREGFGSAAPTLAVALARTIVEICRVLLPPRRLGATALFVKRKMSNYGVKHAGHSGWPRPTRFSSQAVRGAIPTQLMGIAA